VRTLRAAKAVNTTNSMVYNGDRWTNASFGATTGSSST
jgi:hypothetical protein